MNSDSEFLAPEPRRWPLVIGILGIIFGVIGFGGAVFGVVGGFTDPASLPAHFKGAFGWALLAVGTLLAPVPIASGIQLIRHRVGGIQLLQAWVPLVLISQSIGISQLVIYRDEVEDQLREISQKAIDEQAAKVGGTAAKLPAGYEKFMWMTQMACGSVFGFGPPLIVSFFVFGRRGREAAAEWSQPAV